MRGFLSVTSVILIFFPRASVDLRKTVSTGSGPSMKSLSHDKHSTPIRTDSVFPTHWQANEHQHMSFRHVHLSYHPIGKERSVKVLNSRLEGLSRVSKEPYPIGWQYCLTQPHSLMLLVWILWLGLEGQVLIKCPQLQGFLPSRKVDNFWWHGWSTFWLSALFWLFQINLYGFLTKSCLERELKNPCVTFTCLATRWSCRCCKFCDSKLSVARLPAPILIFVIVVFCSC